jgi:DNA repair exonuclease SbcCD ATPase subunit
MTNPGKPAQPTSKYEEERLRAAEQSQFVYLQGQIDELRRLLKEQSNKYAWAMEQIRRVEASVSQIEGLLDRQRQEMAQTLDSYRRDITALRKEVAGALVKIDEGLRPMREMQSQIQQLGEARRQDRDAIAPLFSRIDDLERRIASWNAQIKEAEERHRTLQARLNDVTAADEALRDEMRRLSEDLQIEKQSLRRQAVEAQQLVADIHPTLEAHASRLNRLDEIRQHIDLFAEQLPQQIAALNERLNTIPGEIKRVERISTERFLMNQERLEEIRQQQDEKIVALAETEEQHIRQLHTWLDRIDAWLRELEQRQNRTASHVEHVQRESLAYLVDLERRDVRLTETLLAALRAYADEIHAEQVERGRAPQEP